MSKRLQITLDDSEYREIQGMARSRHMSVAECVRQAVERARQRDSVDDVARKLEVIRRAARHNYPTSDIDTMLAEIEQG